VRLEERVGWLGLRRPRRSLRRLAVGAETTKMEFDDC